MSSSRRQGGSRRNGGGDSFRSSWPRWCDGFARVQALSRQGKASQPRAGARGAVVGGQGRLGQGAQDRHGRSRQGLRLGACLFAPRGRRPPQCALLVPAGAASGAKQTAGGGMGRHRKHIAAGTGVSDVERPIEPSSRRIADFAIAGLIVALAVTLSPIGIRLMTGRLDLSPRITVLSLTFCAFLLVIAAAVPSRGRLKVLMFYLLTLSFPLVLLATIETAAIAFHLADRLAPLEDMSTLVNRSGWPAHLMSAGRKVEKDGLQLYRPWQGHEIIINELGLRAAPPTPKRSGEWRIAITGGSVAFGWRVRDADTIPVQVQEQLHERGFSNVTV